MQVSNITLFLDEQVFSKHKKVIGSQKKTFPELEAAWAVTLVYCSNPTLHSQTEATL